jgi:hypothetical protein
LSYGGNLCCNNHEKQFAVNVCAHFREGRPRCVPPQQALHQSPGQAAGTVGAKVQVLGLHQVPGQALELLQQLRSAHRLLHTLQKTEQLWLTISVLFTHNAE